jgi:hypothetical protein
MFTSQGLNSIDKLPPRCCLKPLEPELTDHAQRAKERVQVPIEFGWIIYAGDCLQKVREAAVVGRLESGLKHSEQNRLNLEPAHDLLLLRLESRAGNSHRYFPACQESNRATFTKRPRTAHAAPIGELAFDPSL